MFKGTQHHPLTSLSKLTLLGVGLVLSVACAKTTDALMVVEQANSDQTSTQQASSEKGLDVMAEADVYLGERHDSQADHAAQLEIIQAMHRRNPNLAIALEMFQRPFQAPLDQYIAGEIDEATLVQNTEYEQRWGFPWELYAPILRYAKQHQIKVLALNTPSEVSHKIARSGLESLEGDELKFIPAPTEIDQTNQAYRDFVGQAFGAHGSHGNFNFDNFFAAQVTWDETMAERVAQFRRAQPQTQVIVLAGQGHVIYGYGIPDRVKRRLGDNLNQKIVFLNPATQPKDDRIADILWYSDPSSNVTAAPQ